jgi:hypothetical protein
MFDNKSIRLDSGSRFHLNFNNNFMNINYTYNNSAKKIQVNLDDLTVTKIGTTAYCDEVIMLSSKTLYRIRNNIVIK